MSAQRQEEAEAQLDQDDARAFCQKHHIDYDRWGVWLNRPYVRWKRNDLSPIRDAYKGLRGLGSTLYKAGQSDGWIITRHPHADLLLPRIYPEIRPDNKVKRAGLPTRHYHGDRNRYPELYPKPGELPAKDIHTPEEFAGHINRDKGDPDDHKGINEHAVHQHDHWAKYCFAETVTIRGFWPHCHANMRSRAMREAHLQARKRHGGRDHPDADWHWHWDWVKDPDQALAKRIEMHPFAAELFRGARRVSFQLEGCIKEDATLTDILEEELSASVLSVPSVTLWDAKELPLVNERLLLGRDVLIGIDADGSENAKVMTLALLFRTVLRQMGTHARIEAPPLDAWERDHELKGHDDHFAAGGKFEDLEVIGLEPSPLVDEYIEDAGRHWQYRVRERVGRLVRSLSVHAYKGRYSGSIPALARVMEPHRDWSALRYFRGPVPIDDEVKAWAKRRHRNSDLVKAIQRDLDRLEEIGAIEIEGNRNTLRKFWRANEDWEDRPTIVITPELRAIDQPRRKLGK